MINEAIILAGGLGTRLRSAVPDLPKCMAPVAGRPFLFYVINYLQSQGINRFIFSLGYKHELIEGFLKEYYPSLDYNTSIEEEPLGTGGAVRKACVLTISKNVLVLNGDTFFAVNIPAIALVHEANEAACTLALKPMTDSDRYGVVETRADGRIVSFKEKKWYDKSLINGGVYFLNVPLFSAITFPEKFSFEKEYLENYYASKQIYGLVQDGYFIDIGIPSDYNKAQSELLNLLSINNQWTLFLDRDGVINHEKETYIFNKEEFIFYDGVLEALKIFNDIFKYIIIVTNQRGVGKQLMTEADLTDIHDHMLQEINNNGGRIDKIYYCTSMDNAHPNRKPNPGMALEAMKDNPLISRHHSLMVGNNMSDMKFGKNAGIFTALLNTTGTSVELPHPLVDFQYNSLIEFAHYLKPPTAAEF